MYITVPIGAYAKRSIWNSKVWVSFPKDLFPQSRSVYSNIFVLSLKLLKMVTF